MSWVESAEAIEKVDELLASVGLGHGRRKTCWLEPGRVASGGVRLKEDGPGNRFREKGLTARPGAWVGEVSFRLRHGFSATGWRGVVGV